MKTDAPLENRIHLRKWNSKENVIYFTNNTAKFTKLSHKTQFQTKNEQT